MSIEIPDAVATNFFLSNIERAVCSGKVHVGRCPVCGDSIKKYKRHLYLLKHHQKSWLIYCQKCNCSMSLWKFAKNYFPEQFVYLKQSTLRNLLFDNPNQKEEKISDADIIDILKDVHIREKRTFLEVFLDNHCFKVVYDHDNPEIRKKAIEIIKWAKKRLIPDKYIKTLYYCFENNEEREWFYKDRIIIPFYDNEHRPYYFQARATIKDQEPKYLNWDTGHTKPEFNEYHVDTSKTVYIVEGLINSMFIENAVSTLGVKVSEERVAKLEQKYPNCVFCLDNDFKDKQVGRVWTRKLLKMGKKCLVFPEEFAKINDINDIAIKLNQQDLTDFAKKNTHTGIIGLLKLGKLESSN